MQKLLGNIKKGLIFVLSSPSGAGKTTLVRMLSSEFDCVVESISYTTKKPREEEKEAIDYFYISEKEFEKKIKEGFFLEHAKVYNNYYGTSKEFIKKTLDSSKHIVLVIDTQGAMQLKKLIDAIYIFISPPSISELEKRMQKRKGDQDIEKRLQAAEKELEQISNYDYNIINDNLKMTYNILKSILIAEEHKVKNLKK